MGYGKCMLKDDVVEERFGLKVILMAGINDYDLDINRDLVTNITGVSEDESYAKGMLSERIVVDRQARTNYIT